MYNVFEKSPFAGPEVVECPHRVVPEGLVIDLRTDGIAGVMRDLMTPRQLEAAE